MNAATPTGAEPTTGRTGVWIIELRVAVPGSQAATLDDAINLVGDKLDPLHWSGRINRERIA